MNNVIDFDGNEFECLAVLVLCVLYLPQRFTCLRSYSLWSGCARSLMVSITVRVVPRWNNLSRWSWFVPTLALHPACSSYFVECDIALFLNVISPTIESKTHSISMNSRIFEVGFDKCLKKT